MGGMDLGRGDRKAWGGVGRQGRRSRATRRTAPHRSHTAPATNWSGRSSSSRRSGPPWGETIAVSWTEPWAQVGQRGGDVLIDPAGIVRVHHVGDGPADRPSVESLLAAIRGPAT